MGWSMIVAFPGHTDFKCSLHFFFKFIFNSAVLVHFFKKVC